MQWLFACLCDTSFLSGYVTADHSVNGDSCSDGENEDFAMVEDQICRLHNLCE